MQKNSSLIAYRQRRRIADLLRVLLFNENLYLETVALPDHVGAWRVAADAGVGRHRLEAT
jgi:hypothetical protein